MWIFVASFAFFEAVSTFVFLAAASFSPATLTDPARLVSIGHRGRRSFASCRSAGHVRISVRRASGDLPARAVSGTNAIDFFTLAGILFAVLGSLGAVTLAFVGTPLIREYVTASAAGREFLATMFATIYRFVFFGIWQTLDGFVAGVWLFGTGRLAWRQGAKPLALVLLASGVFGFGFAIAHIAGVYV